MIRVSVIGGAGYTGGELLRLLVHHPEVEIVSVSSRSQAGRPFHAVHPDLLGMTDQTFVAQIDDKVDAVFMCMAHGDARAYIKEKPLPAGVKIIDLSSDFRIKGAHSYVYGLPELNREVISRADRIANPGCFATAIQLALLPLAEKALLPEEVHIHGITGSTGAGQSLSPTSHFSWRNDNLSIYKAFTHQHLHEINQSLLQLHPGFSGSLNFLPLRGPFARGILISAYVNLDLAQDTAREMYTRYYEPHPFTHVSDVNPNLKQVVQTNNAVVHVVQHEGKILIVSIIDNLLKGASGQAVQNFNLMFGLNETTGLQLKPGGY